MFSNNFSNQVEQRPFSVSGYSSSETRLGIGVKEINDNANITQGTASFSVTQTRHKTVYT